MEGPDGDKNKVEVYCKKLVEFIDEMKAAAVPGAERFKQKNPNRFVTKAQANIHHRKMNLHERMKVMKAEAHAKKEGEDEEVEEK